MERAVTARQSRLPPPLIGQRIIAACAEAERVTIAALVGPEREQRIFRARAACAWAMRVAAMKSTVQIGIMLGGRDHSTICSMLARAERLRGECMGFRRLSDHLIDVAMAFMRQRDDVTAVYKPSRQAVMIAIGADILEITKDQAHRLRDQLVEALDMPAMAARMAAATTMER